MQSTMNIRPHGGFDTEMKEMGNVWFCGPSTCSPSAPKLSALTRFLNCPKALFIASMATWPVVLGALALCAKLDSPRLIQCLTAFIAATGFACAELSVIDCGQSFYKQRLRILAAFFCWAAIGLVILRVFAFL
jgi:hypothetical protein